MAPTGFLLYRSLSNVMRGVSINSDAELRAWLDELLESKPGHLNQQVVENLVERLEEVANSNGEYIID